MMTHAYARRPGSLNLFEEQQLRHIWLVSADVVQHQANVKHAHI